MPLSLEAFLPWLDLAGLSVFAASGALAAARKRLDFTGACFFALITATVGVTLRDVLIGAPIFWMQNPAPALLCVVIALAAWIIPLRWWLERALDWFDAAGLAVYAVYGAGKALQCCWRTAIHFTAIPRQGRCPRFGSVRHSRRARAHRTSTSRAGIC